MHAVKHLFWLHPWQLVGSVHPPGGLVGLQGSLNGEVHIFFKAFENVFCPTCEVAHHTWCQTAHAWLFMYAETCQRCAIAKRQWGPGQQPSSMAAWQAALALGWPLPPPGCPRSLTSLAWQQQPNKLRAPQSSHRSMGMFFTAPTPTLLFMVIMVCVLYTNTPTCQIKSRCCLLRGLKKHTQACMFFTSTLASLSTSVMNTVGADLVVVWVKNALKF